MSRKEALTAGAFLLARGKLTCTESQHTEDRPEKRTLGNVEPH